MKNLLFLAVILPLSVIGQQLVLNPDFEQYDQCPTALNQMDRALFWSSPTTTLPGTGTPDYYNACSTSFAVGVPTNQDGYQVAHSGVGYAKFGCYEPTQQDFREYVQGTLSERLQAGQCYRFQAFLNLTACTYATTHIGVWFGQSSVTGVSNWLPLPLTPQVVYNGPIISDTLGWTEMTGDFVAQGDEVAFIIGLFEDDASATFELAYPDMILDQSSYFIDDVTVVPIGTPSQPCVLPASVQVNEATSPLIWYDPETRVISLRDDVEGDGQLVIYDLTGRRIETVLVSHSRHHNVSHLPTGSYLVALQIHGMRKSVERIIVY